MKISTGMLGVVIKYFSAFVVAMVIKLADLAYLLGIADVVVRVAKSLCLTTSTISMRSGAVDGKLFFVSGTNHAKNGSVLSSNAFFVFIFSDVAVVESILL